MLSFQHFVSLNFSLSAILIAAISSSAALPVGSLNASDIGSTIWNTSLGYAPDDFTVAPSRSTGAELEKYPCLMQALTALGYVASQDFDQSMPPVSFGGPYLSLDVEGPIEKSSIEGKYAVWGLYVVMGYMLGQKDFRARAFYLQWQGDLVGVIRFNELDQMNIVANTKNGLDRSIQQIDTSALSNPTAISINSTIGGTFVDGDLTYNIEFSGQDLTETRVFMTVCAALVEVAPEPASTAIQDFEPDSSRFRTELELKDPFSRTSPPFLTYQQMIKILVQIPAFCLGAGERWGGVYMSAYVNHIVVAMGFLLGVRRLGISASNSSDVSAS
ncbi:hypothetical protein MMC28_001449 [Mycoblastus sanguinarius]|nr:hypothetical protein [Mycoblastus sanguinarius]